MTGDGRPQAVHPRPSHALSQAERVGLLRMAVGADRKFARRQHALNHSARGTFFRGKAWQGKRKGRLYRGPSGLPETQHAQTAPLRSAN